MTKLPQKVYCVIDKKTGERLSQFYVRKLDAINKKQKDYYYSQDLDAVSFDLGNLTVLSDNLDD